MGKRKIAEAKLSDQIVAAHSDLFFQACAYCVWRPGDRVTQLDETIEVFRRSGESREASHLTRPLAPMIVQQTVEVLSKLKGEGRGVLPVEQNPRAVFALAIAAT